MYPRVAGTPQDRDRIRVLTRAYERQLLVAALNKFTVRRDAARFLGITYSKLLKYMNRHGIRTRADYTPRLSFKRPCRVICMGILEPNLVKRKKQQQYPYVSVWAESESPKGLLAEIALSLSTLPKTTQEQLPGCTLKVLNAIGQERLYKVHLTKRGLLVTP